LAGANVAQHFAAFVCEVGLHGRLDVRGAGEFELDDFGDERIRRSRVFDSDPGNLSFRIFNNH